MQIDVVNLENNLNLLGLKICENAKRCPDNPYPLSPPLQNQDFHFLLQDPGTLELIFKRSGKPNASSFDTFLNSETTSKTPSETLQKLFRNPSRNLLGSGGSVAGNEILTQKHYKHGKIRGELIFGSLHSFHVIHCVSRNYTWKSRILCVIYGVGQYIEKFWGI